MDSGQYNQVIYLWVFLKVLEIQERHRENKFNNDPKIIGLMVQHIMMHDREHTLEQQPYQFTTHIDKIDTLCINIGEYHKEYVEFQERLKTTEEHVSFTKQK